MRADKVTAWAIFSGAAGLLFSGPTLLASGLFGWTGATLWICSAITLLGQIGIRSRAQQKLLAILQEHAAALNPEAAKHSPASVEAATQAIVDSAEQIVSRAASKSNELEIRVRELEMQHQLTQAALDEIDAAFEDASTSVLASGQPTELTFAAAERDQIRAQKRDKELREIKTAFVSKVSHELRTPLASIKAYIEMLIDGEASDAATQMQFYEIIQNEANRLGKLIDGTLKSPA